MDLASTLRVLWKHKLLVGFLLVLTIAASVGSFMRATSKEQASGSYVLIAAKPPSGVTGEAQLTPYNPFGGMDQGTIVDIIVRTMSTAQVATELQAEGLVGTYAVEGNRDFVRGPLVELTVTAPDSGTALDDYELLAVKVQDVLKAKQLEGGANEDYLMTLQRVQDPALTRPGLVGQLRTSIAIFAIGLVVTLAAALALESWQRSGKWPYARRAAVDGPSDDRGPGGTDTAPAARSGRNGDRDADHGDDAYADEADQLDDDEPFDDDARPDETAQLDDEQADELDDEADEADARRGRSKPKGPVMGPRHARATSKR